MKLHLGNLEKAISQLRIGMCYTESASPDTESEYCILYRLAAIKSFEYTYEINVKMIQRQLKNVASDAESIAKLSLKDLIRTAAEKGIVANPKDWFVFREMRNITSHTYDEDKVKQILQSLPEFVEAASQVLNSINKGK